MMQRSLAAFFVAFGVFAIFAVACSSPAPEAPSASPRREALRVVATLSPLAFVAGRVAGTGVEVATLLPAGRSPHTYEATPGDVRRGSHAQVVVRAGHPSFPFEERLLRSLVAPDGPAVVNLWSLSGEAQGERAGEPVGDPHVWLSPPRLERLATVLAHEFSRLDPAGRAGYEERAQGFKAELAAVDARIAALLAASPCKVYLVDHPAWGAFDARYGVRQLAIEREGKEPSPATLAAVAGEVAAHHLRVLFVEPRRPVASRNALAAAFGVEVAELDPLAPDLLANLERVATAIARSCEHDERS